MMVNKNNTKGLLKHISKSIKSNFQKDLDTRFDQAMNDNINSAEERKKLNAVRLKAGGQDITGDIMRGAMDGLAGDGNNTSISKYYKNIQANKEKNKHLIILPKTIQKIKKSINQKPKDEQYKIYKILLSMYKNIDNLADFKPVSEAFEEFKKINKILTSDDIEKLLKLVRIRVYDNKRRGVNLSNISHRDVESYYINEGRPLKKKYIIIMMKKLKLTDLQIVDIFEKIKKPLSYNELSSYGIDIDQTYKNISNGDLKKFAYSLGKDGLKKFLNEFRKDIF